MDTHGRQVRDNHPMHGAQRFEAWWERVPESIDHTYVSGGQTRRRFALADPTDIDAIAFSPRSGEVLITEFKRDVAKFLTNKGQSNAIRRTAQLPGVRARVVGEPGGQLQDRYAEDTVLPFATVEQTPQYGTLTVRQLAERFAALRAGERLPSAPVSVDGRGIEAIASWWPADLPTGAAPHHIPATFQVGFGRAKSHHLVIDFVRDLTDTAALGQGKLRLLAHLSTLPNVTALIVQDPHHGQLTPKGFRYDRDAPMPFLLRAGSRREQYEATVGSFNAWIHQWLLAADTDS